VRVERLTATFLRVVLGGPGMADYQVSPWTDRYVKLVLPPFGVRYPEPFNIEAIRTQHPEQEWPRLRTYTVRGQDLDAGEVWIDLFDHGDTGRAVPWARRAQPGEPVRFFGPNGAYAPDAAADWHLLVGDEVAFPAIASAVEALPVDAHLVVVLEADDDASFDYLALPTHAQVLQLRRDLGDPDLVAALRSLELPDGVPQVFAHGELATMRVLRRHLLDERAVDLAHLSLSGYWRRGKDEDGFQAEKHEEAAPG
jgi:NADPH-dependent ferric siderophore reductase